MLEAFVTRRGGTGGGLPTNSAVICIICDAGSTITLSKGGVVAKTLDPSKSHLINGTTNAAWYYSVSPANYGTWTIDAVLGEQTASATVAVSENKQYEVNVSYDLYLIKNGVAQNGFSIANAGGTLSQDLVNGYVNLHSSASTGTYATLYLTPNVDLTLYKTLTFDGQARGYYESPHTPSFGVINSTTSGSNHTTFRAARLIRSNGGNTLSGRATLTLSIENFTGSYRIGGQEAGSGANSWQGDLRIYNLYMSQR